MLERTQVEVEAQSRGGALKPFERTHPAIEAQRPRGALKPFERTQTETEAQAVRGALKPFERGASSVVADASAPSDFLPETSDAAEAGCAAGGAGSSEGWDHRAGETQIPSVSDPSDDLIFILADSLGDIEATRIANENRLRSLADNGLGETYAAHKLAEIVTGLLTVEKDTTKTLERAMRQHPLGPWIERTVGIGLKQGARLIAAIGPIDWRTATLDDEGNVLEPERPRRGPAELWAYCGFAPSQKRRKGVRSNWSAEAKMRAFLVSESCVKQRHSPYRSTYDKARASWADRDTPEGHKHAHALRLTAKAILRDLFLEARRLRLESARGAVD